MTTQRTLEPTDMSAFEEALRERILHWFPDDPRYRLSGHERPREGDVAFCGHVKTTPPIGDAEARCLPECGRCVLLKRIEGYA